MMTPHLPVAEFVARRQKVLQDLDGAVGLVLAGDGAKADLNFVYLTGISGESGAAVLFDGENPHADRRVTLLLKPLDTEADRWAGYRDPIDAAMRERTGFTHVARTGQLPGLLTAALRRGKRAACLHPFAVYPAAVSGDLAAFGQVQARVPGIRVDDRTGLLTGLRSAKSPAELKLIERAAAITTQAYAHAVPHIRPGLNEGQVQLALETVYRQQGGDVAYGTIVGGGIGGTVLHYVANDRTLAEGDLLVIDSAASFGGYAADVTRTYPVGGRFTPDQRELYEVVLAAELAAIKAAKAGVRLHELDAVARAVIDKAGLGDAFIHSIGHPLGLSVHDVVPDGPLPAGAVITIEPGVYLPERKVGIRIEDDLVLTKTGSRNLTAAIPKTVKDVEASMRPV